MVILVQGDQDGAPLVDRTNLNTPRRGTFLVRCCLLLRRCQGEADRLCIPAGGGLLAQVLRECRDGPLVGQAKTGSLVWRPAFWVGQDVAAAIAARWYDWD